MIELLQAATLPQTGPTWQSVAVVCGALLQGLILSWMSASQKDRQSLHEAVSTIQGEIRALNTHVGVDGNGIIARLDAITIKLDKLAEEMAEARGSRTSRTHRTGESR